MLGQLHLWPAHGTKLRQRVEVMLADTAEVNALLARVHYLRRKRVRPGLAYQILLDGRVVGFALFAYPFCIARKIGGIPRNQVIELARFWLGENVPHLASAALARILRRVADDWHRKFPYLPRPAAVVSWADLEQGHEGTIYKATGAEVHGIGGGTTHHAERTPGRYIHSDYLHKKRRFLWRLKGEHASS